MSFETVPLSLRSDGPSDAPAPALIHTSHENISSGHITRVASPRCSPTSPQDSNSRQECSQTSSPVASVLQSSPQYVASATAPPNVNPTSSAVASTSQHSQTSPRYVASTTTPPTGNQQSSAVAGAPQNNQVSPRDVASGTALNDNQMSSPSHLAPVVLAEDNVSSVSAVSSLRDLNALTASRSADNLLQPSNTLDSPVDAAREFHERSQERTRSHSAPVALSARQQRSVQARLLSPVSCNGPTTDVIIMHTEADINMAREFEKKVKKVCKKRSKKAHVMTWDERCPGGISAKLVKEKLLSIRAVLYFIVTENFLEGYRRTPYPRTVTGVMYEVLEDTKDSERHLVVPVKLRSEQPPETSVATVFPNIKCLKMEDSNVKREIATNMNMGGVRKKQRFWAKVPFKKSSSEIHPVDV